MASIKIYHSKNVFYSCQWAACKGFLVGTSTQGHQLFNMLDYWCNKWNLQLVLANNLKFSKVHIYRQIRGTGKQLTIKWSRCVTVILADARYAHFQHVRQLFFINIIKCICFTCTHISFVMMHLTQCIRADKLCVNEHVCIDQRLQFWSMQLRCSLTH